MSEENKSQGKKLIVDESVYGRLVQLAATGTNNTFSNGDVAQILLDAQRNPQEFVEAPEADKPTIKKVAKK